MLTSFVIYLLIGLTLVENSQSFVNVKDLSCQFNSDLCTNTICSKFTGKSRIKIVFVNLGFFLIKPVEHPRVHFTLYRQSGETYTPFLLDAEEDLCDFIHNVVRNPLLAQTFLSVGEHLHSIRCPLVGNVTVVKLPVSFNMPPGIFPNSQYKIVTELRKDGKFILSVNVTFRRDKGRLL